jgi:glucose-1-phosphate cytidylyltransferase
MEVVVLCSALGTRLRKKIELRPKPMVEIGGRPIDRPILWHIMQMCEHYGTREFIVRSAHV